MNLGREGMEKLVAGTLVAGEIVSGWVVAGGGALVAAWVSARVR